MSGQMFPADRKRGQYFDVDPVEDLCVIGLDTTHSSVFEHRLYDRRVFLELDQLMVQNVKSVGITSDILFVRTDTSKDERYGRFFGRRVSVVADGRHRTRWIRAANLLLIEEGLPTLRAPAREMIGSELLRLMKSRAANIHVETPPITLAMEYTDMLGMGITMEDLCNTYAKSPEDVKEVMRFLELSEQSQKLLQDGKISRSSARLLLGVTHAEQDEKIDEIIASGKKLTVERTRAALADPTRSPTVRKGLNLKQMAALYKDAEGHLDAPTKRLLGVMLGHTRPRLIAGMTKALAAIGFTPEAIAAFGVDEKE